MDYLDEWWAREVIEKPESLEELENASSLLRVELRSDQVPTFYQD